MEHDDYKDEQCVAHDPRILIACRCGRAVDAKEK